MVEAVDLMAVLDEIHAEALAHLSIPFITTEDIQKRIHYVVHADIGACVRVLMAGCLAKIDKPQIDIRRPYANLGADSYSGRDYDEKYISLARSRYFLPYNQTTGFLTPALRAKNVTFTSEVTLHGRDSQLYEFFIQLLDDVYAERISARTLLVEIMRQLLAIRDEQDRRMQSLLSELRWTKHD
ncbi:DNA methyltransferase, partial [Chloroflexota bacterium]